MSWAVGWDGRHQRDIGYGVPATCDRPKCGAEIDRGLAYVCGGEPYGGEHGCGLYFCGAHLTGTRKDGDRWVHICGRCDKGRPPYEPTPDVAEWIEHKLTDESWEQWRAENAELVEQVEASLVSARSARTAGD
jgi:hypothetical protein